ncbi:MAG: hypothetical protein GXO75_20695, partial [Calditrichaeota bacterium]|nr:hypothetical protein [Calditrichota bacterium]
KAEQAGGIVRLIPEVQKGLVGLRATAAVVVVPVEEAHPVIREAARVPVGLPVLPGPADDLLPAAKAQTAVVQVKGDKQNIFNQGVIK